jgi:hypothetical protein
MDIRNINDDKNNFFIFQILLHNYFKLKEWFSPVIVQNYPNCYIYTLNIVS